MIKSFILGAVLACLVLGGGVYYYFASGMAPAAVTDSPMPFEKKMAKLSLDVHIQKQPAVQSPVPADEPNFLAGAGIYKEHCEICHGGPGQTSDLATAMYPPPPQLLKGKGVSDDPASETHWKVVNGIRLTGMPSFKAILDDKQSWQVSQLLAHSNELPDGVKKALAPDLASPSPAK